mgnify:CR=1 FL=1
MLFTVVFNSSFLAFSWASMSPIDRCACCDFPLSASTSFEPCLPSYRTSIYHCMFYQLMCLDMHSSLVYLRLALHVGRCLCHLSHLLPYVCFACCMILVLPLILHPDYLSILSINWLMQVPFLSCLQVSIACWSRGIWSCMNA